MLSVAALVALVVVLVGVAAPVQGTPDRVEFSSATIQILLVYPSANLKSHQTISLRGSTAGLNWQSGVPFTFLGNNTWSYSLSYTVAKYAGQTLQFKPLVDDSTWSMGANFQVALPEDNTWVRVYPWFYTVNGTYELLPEALYSPQLNNSRQLIIYTPPSYYENTLKPMNNVLLMHDGENLFNASTSFNGVAWECQVTINQLIAEQKIDEVFIIGVYNTPNRINEYTYSYAKDCQCPLGGGGQGDLYLDFLIEQVVPYVEQRYRIETGPNNLAMMGSSLGGLISCYAGWTRPNTWGKVGCMSSSFWWNNEDFNNIIINDSMVQAPVTIYVDSGTSGEGNDDMEQTIAVRNHLEALDFVLNRDLFYYLDVGGQHNEYYWGRRFWVPMTDFYTTKLLSPQ